VVRLEIERKPSATRSGGSMTNPKGDLIEYCRVQGLGTPNFETIASGPEHQPIFTCEIVISDQVWGTAQARTKRDAEKHAAAQALAALEQGHPVSNAAVSSRTSSWMVDPGQTKDPDDLNHDPDDDLDEEGPWPIFPEVLSRCLEIANGRVDQARTGAQAVDEIKRLSLELYKGVLEELGEYM
jgi:ribonuclease-3